MLAKPEEHVVEELVQKKRVIEKKWSYSRLSCFLNCKRQFFYKYIEKRKTPSSNPMIVGKIFHAAIELMVREGISPEEALLRASYPEEDLDIEVSYNGLPEEERPYFIIRMLNNAYRRIEKKTKDNPYVEITSELHLEIPTTKGLLQGYVDLIIDDPSTDTTEIWDFKTGWTSFEAATSKQLALYAWMFLQMRGIVGSTYRARLVFPRLSHTEDTEVELTEEIMEEAKQWAIDTISEVLSLNPNNVEEWELTDDRRKCEYCPFVNLCSSGLIEELPANGEPKDTQEAEKVGEFILMYETLIKNMKAGLKKFVKEEGDVQVGDGAYTLQKSEPNPKCDDTQALIDYAEKYNLNVSKLLKPDSKYLKELLEEDPTGELKEIISWTKPRESFKYEKGRLTKVEKESQGLDVENQRPTSSPA